MNLSVHFNGAYLVLKLYETMTCMSLVLAQLHSELVDYSQSSNNKQYWKVRSLNAKCVNYKVRNNPRITYSILLQENLEALHCGKLVLQERTTGTSEGVRLHPCWIVLSYLPMVCSGRTMGSTWYFVQVDLIN